MRRRAPARMSASSAWPSSASSSIDEHVVDGRQPGLDERGAQVGAHEHRLAHAHALGRQSSLRATSLLVPSASASSRACHTSDRRARESRSATTRPVALSRATRERVLRTEVVDVAHVLERAAPRAAPRRAAARPSRAPRAAGACAMVPSRSVTRGIVGEARRRATRWGAPAPRSSAASAPRRTPASSMTASIARRGARDRGRGGDAAAAAPSTPPASGTHDGRDQGRTAREDQRHAHPRRERLLAHRAVRRGVALGAMEAVCGVSAPGRESPARRARRGRPARTPRGAPDRGRGCPGGLQAPRGSWAPHRPLGPGPYRQTGPAATTRSRGAGPARDENVAPRGVGVSS